MQNETDNTVNFQKGNDIKFITSPVEKVIELYEKLLLARDSEISALKNKINELNLLR